MPASGFIAVLVIDLHFPDAGSLKSKRKELSSIKAQLHGRLGAAVSEVEHQDLWQRARLTAALTAGSLSGLARAADNVERWLDARVRATAAGLADATRSRSGADKKLASAGSRVAGPGSACSTCAIASREFGESCPPTNLQQLFPIAAPGC